jgi:hypothetical protein
MIEGILLGLAAAFGQSLTYFAARHYVQRRVGTEGGARSGSRELLVLSHVWMGLFSLVLFAGLLIAGWPGWQNELTSTNVWIPALQIALYYMMGQVGLFLALRHSEASRVSAMLGFKIAVLAIMSSFFVTPHMAGDTSATGQAGLTATQWLAVALSVLAALALGSVGTLMRKRAIFGVLLACVFFSLSDWYITKTCVALRELGEGRLVASMIGVVLCHGACGIAGVVALPLWGSSRKRDWIDALPYAVSWFVAILILYACFATVGPLLGNILQSTRGLMSILMGVLVAKWGHLHIEPLSGKGVFIRRMAAGLLMFFAVSLYAIRDPSQFRDYFSRQVPPHPTTQTR